MKSLLSRQVLKQSAKNNWKLWTILTGVLCFFVAVTTFILGNSDGAGQGGMSAGGAAFVERMYSAMFFGASGLGVIFMLILLITEGNKLVAGEIDRGTMSFILNTPTTRKQIIFSKALFYICSLIAMLVSIGLFASIANLIAGTGLDLGNLWLVILGCLLFGFATSGICFAASCWFNKSGNSLMVGAGLPVAFFLFNSLSSLPDLEFLKYFSLNTLFDTANILSGSNFIIQFIAMFVLGAVLYTVGINKFLRKDLPL